MLEQVPAKLIISDQKMDPGMRGTEFLAKVKARHPHVVTMILSAFAESEYIMDALNKAGAYQYITKPWNADELIHKVKQALRFYHSEAERRRLAEANQRLLKKMAFLETFSLVGDFSEALYARFSPLLATLMKDAVLKAESSGLKGLDNHRVSSAIISRLGQLAMMATLESQKDLQLKRQEIVPILKSCVSEARQQVKDVEFVEEYDKHLPELVIYPELFQVSIKALIENAVIFNKDSKEKKVIVRAKRVQQDDEDLVVVQVEDNGPGIGEDLKGKVFTPLHSTYPQEASAGEIMPELGYYNFGYYYHVGLGLPIAKWCVTRHDGLLDFSSEAGKGSTFFIQIPTEQADLKQQQGLV